MAVSRWTTPPYTATVRSLKGASSRPRRPLRGCNGRVACRCVWRANRGPRSTSVVWFWNRVWAKWSRRAASRKRQGRCTLARHPGSRARVKRENGRNVLVSAVRGALRVTNAGGVHVARMETGNSMVFEPQATGATAPTRATGCLLEKDGKFLLAERTTNVVLELQRSDLDKQLGNQVEISGKAETASPRTEIGRA